MSICRWWCIHLKKEHYEALQYDKSVDYKREDIQLQTVKSTPSFWKCIWLHGIKISGVRNTGPIATSQSWSVDKVHLCFTQLAEAKYYAHISWCHRRNAWCRELGGRIITGCWRQVKAEGMTKATFLHSHNYRRNVSDVRDKYAAMFWSSEVVPWQWLMI